jgi:hypothetical protein
MRSNTIRRALALSAIPLALGLSACGGGGGAGASAADASPVALGDWPAVVADGDAYEGRRVEDLVGRVFVVERDSDALAVQMWTTSDFGDGNTIVGVPAEEAPSPAPEDGDFVRVSGEIAGSFEGENAFGATVSAPTVRADEIEVIPALEAYPADAVTPVGRFLTQEGVTLTLEKVERVGAGGRLYLRARNDGSQAASIYSYGVKLVQDGRQSESESVGSYTLDLPSFSGDLLPGASEEAVVEFARLDKGTARFVLDWFTPSYSERSFDFIVTVR